MARITIEDCLKRVKNRFLLVNLAAKRVRQIREGSEYLVSSPKNEDIVVSLREIAAGKITIKEGKEEKEEEEIKEEIEEKEDDL
ncbi:MAG: DNA-directed RNA polymerase subunit omega [Desulfobacterales bacterium]